MRSVRWAGTASTVAFLLVIGAIAPATASALRVATTRVSGRSPFPTRCGADQNPMYTQNSAVEPDVAVDPLDPRHVVAAWIQDDGSTILTSSSKDAGRTWTRALVPGLTQCTGGTDPAVADPWLSFASHRKLYLSSGAGRFVDDRAVTEAIASRSHDGGLSWSRPSFPQRATGAWWDKQTITADPADPKRAYLVQSRRPSARRPIGSLYLYRTRDGGRRWSNAQRVYDSPTPGAIPLNNGTAIVDRQTIVVVFELVNFNGGRVRIEAIRSTDRGRDWKPAVELGTVAQNFPGAGGPQPATDPAGVVEFGLALPSIAAAPNGDVYVAWSDLRTSGRSRIVAARSKNGGASWSRTHPLTRTRAQPFSPTIAITNAGTIGATYYLADRASAGKAWPARVAFAWSRNRGRTWRRSRIAGPTNLRTAEHPGGGAGIRIGDYFGLAARPRSFVAAYVLAKPQAAVPPQNVFLTRIGFGRHR
jgi:BNR repeat protein